MLCRLDKDDLENLVKTINPSQDMCIELEKLGIMKSYGGGFSSHGWNWGKAFLENLTEVELYNLYRDMKKLKKEV